MIWRYKSIEDWKNAPTVDKQGRDIPQGGTSPGPVSGRLKTTRQRVHYLINAGYLDAVYIQEGLKTGYIYISDESVDRFLKNPPPKPGPKKRVSIPEIAKWVLKGFWEDVKARRSLTVDEMKKWLESTKEGKDFRLRLRDQYGPKYYAIEEAVIAAAVGLGLKKPER